MAKNTLKKATPRLFEQKKVKKKALIKELKKGEQSGFVQNFDHKKFLKNMEANK